MPKRRKYRNKPTNGYDSRAEARRAKELAVLERCGLIAKLEQQVRFELIPKQGLERAVHYVADFRYVDNETGSVVVEDVKGMRTQVYVLKRKLMLQVHGIQIREVK